MRHDSYAGMLSHIVDTVVVGRDTILASDDPMARTVGFTVSSPIGAEEHFVTLTASQEGLRDDQRSLLASGQKGRKRMAALMTAGVPKHGHGFRRSRDCPLCLASDVMES